MGTEKKYRWYVSALWLGVLFVLLAVVAADPAAACPNCKESIAASGAQDGSLAAGYAASIFLLLGMPVVIGGVLGGLAWLTVRRAAAQRLSLTPAATGGRASCRRSPP